MDLNRFNSEKPIYFTKERFMSNSSWEKLGKNKQFGKQSRSDSVYFYSSSSNFVLPSATY